MFRIIASLFHARPGIILRRMTQAMSAVGWRTFFKGTATASGMSILKGTQADNRYISTLALTSKMYYVLPSVSMFNNGKPIKFMTYPLFWIRFIWHLHIPLRIYYTIKYQMSKTFTGDSFVCLLIIAINACP